MVDSAPPGDPMKRALLVGVPERDHGGRLDRVLGLEAMEALLDDLGGWSVTTLTGERATRDRVLEALESMVSSCSPDDACLFYFFGHGGVVRFSALEGELGARAVFYLATLRPAGSAERVGVLDIELSEALTRLDQVCGNVTAIIDCCHAAAMVRTAAIPVVPPPAWVRSVAEMLGEPSHREPLLAVESHPRIVRLFGSSWLRRAFARREPEGLYGLLTRSFVELVREAGLRCDRLCWDTVAHRVREQASHERGIEEQRVVLAGPRQRLLFSRATIPVPRSAAFIPSQTGHGWIRAGLLQGVHVGDHWSITDLELGPDRRHREVAVAEVRGVELDCAEVVLQGSLTQPPRGATAIVRRVAPRRPVRVAAGGPFEVALRSSGLLDPLADPTPDADSILVETEAYEVRDPDGRRLRVGSTLDPREVREVVDLLEARARAHRLLTSLASQPRPDPSSTDLRWRWGRLGPRNEPWELPTASKGVPVQLHMDDRIWIELRHRGATPRQWFVCVLELGIEGRLGLLNAHQPEGIELIAGETVQVGLRGARRRQGLTVGWPPRVPADGPRPSRLLVMASHRPIWLGHVLEVPHPDDPTAFAAQRLGLVEYRDVRSGSEPPLTTSHGWTWDGWDYMVDPHVRP